MEKSNQRSTENVAAKKTYVDRNVSICSKAVIEAGCTIADDSVIEYGTVMESDLKI